MSGGGLPGGPAFPVPTPSTTTTTTDTVIARLPPEDGREWEAQCARCGSSVCFDDCTACGGDGIDPFGHDCGEDTCCCLDPEPNLSCGSCDGAGGWRRCISSEEWCREHPMGGRHEVERGAIEWFVAGSRR